MLTETAKGSLIKVTPGLMAGLSRGQFDLDVFKKDILVLECTVAGTSFRELDDIEAELNVQEQLIVKREADNEADKFAIALYFKEVKAGYIPKSKNEVIANLLDAGKSFYGVIGEKEWQGNWLRLEVKIYLKD